MLKTRKPRGTYLAVESSGLAENTHYKCVLDSIIAIDNTTIKHSRFKEADNG